MKVSAKAFQDLLALVESLRQEIAVLKCENRKLKERIHELEHPTNSNNSSIPPSQDENRIPKNLLQTGEHDFHSLDDPLCGNAVVHVRLGDRNAHQQLHRIHHNMALPPVDLLVAIKPIGDTSLAILDGLRVDDP